MADLKETAVWEPTIRQLETSDPVMGGENGVSNTAPRQLANRTFWLKQKTETSDNSISALGNNKADKTIKITGKNGLKGGGDLSKSQELEIDKASAADIKAGTLNKVVAADNLKPLLFAAAPSGAVMYFAAATAPDGWVKANGALVSRITYADLFTAIGTTFGAGDGATTFKLPDLRGEFLRGWDDARNIDTGRAFGAAQGDAIRNITGHYYNSYGGNGGTTNLRNANMVGVFTYIDYSANVMAPASSTAMSAGPYEYGVKFDASRVVPTATENRPRNMALLACIKI